MQLYFKVRSLQVVYGALEKKKICLPTNERAGGLMVVWDVRRIHVIDNLIGHQGSFLESRNAKVLHEDGILGRVRSQVLRVRSLWTSCCSHWCVGMFSSEKSKEKKYQMQVLFDKFIKETMFENPLLRNWAFTW